MWVRKIGPLEVNFRVTVEPKGVLRIVILVLSIIAFSLTAGFSSTDNTERCTASLDDDTNVTITITLEFAYSFHSERFDVIYPSYNTTNGSFVESRCETDFDRNYNSGAEFFVAMGILSMLYSLGSLPVYMVFLNDQWSYSKWIANIDFFASAVFSFVYFIADIVWSAQTAALKNYVDDELERRSSCLVNLVCINRPIHSTDSYLKLDISLVFGWLTMVVWVAILWFLFKDTTIFKDPRAPWANYKKREAGQSSSVQQNPVPETVVPHPTVETKSDQELL